MSNQEDNLVFMEIANEIKSLHNAAVEHIKRKEFLKASILYKRALMITDKICYYKGMAITLFSMSNLAALMGDIHEAISNVADAKDMFIKAELPYDHCDEMLEKLAIAAQKEGIRLEKKGKFQEAIEYYEAAIPFADEKSSKAMRHEINLLRRVINDRERKNSRNA
jgi:tetratricopeptide (TPR) repeat protein